MRAKLVRAEIDLAHPGQKRAARAAELATAAALSAHKLGAVRWRIEALSLAALAHHRLANTEATAEAQEALELLGQRGTIGLLPEVIEARCREVLGPAQ